MGLREDMDALERHIKQGTGKAWLNGEAKPLPPEPTPHAAQIDRFKANQMEGS